jgi:hypothetical protein
MKFIVPPSKPTSSHTIKTLNRRDGSAVQIRSDDRALASRRGVRYRGAHQRGLASPTRSFQTSSFSPQRRITSSSPTEASFHAIHSPQYDMSAKMQLSSRHQTDQGIFRQQMHETGVRCHYSCALSLGNLRMKAGSELRNTVGT